MTVEAFFDLFLAELKFHDKLREYYKYHDDPEKLPFRKAYFCQRLQYIYDQVKAHITATSSVPGEVDIWDVGSGYSTTQIFLALNGIPSRGSTLEFYYEHIPQRLKYWSQYGDMNLVKVSYENVFEIAVKENSEDLIIVQDTLHHLEPLQQSLSIFYRTLRKGGCLIGIEENGSNIVQNIKLYRQRGNNRIIEYYDEGLGKKVLMGNENIRPLKKWKNEFVRAGFEFDDSSVQYVRLFPPAFFKNKNTAEVTAKEQQLAAGIKILREYFFFGVNFIARKKDAR